MGKDDFGIVVDTREKAPWNFEEGGFFTVRKALPAGDYSIIGMEHEVAVERKTLNDFVNTVIWYRDRFTEEMIKLAPYRYKMIVVESSFDDVVEERYKCKAHPKSIIAIACNLHVQFNVPVYFVGDRANATAFTAAWFSVIWASTARVREAAQSLKHDIGEAMKQQ
jgi:DNA excision repair protein ERCC-4